VAESETAVVHSSEIEGRAAVERTDLTPAALGNPDTVADVPSHAWGWSGESPRAFKIAAVVTAVALLAMLRGNQTGHVEDIYLIAFAVALLGFVGRDVLRSRKPH
jgi:hypothetical protein